MNNKYGGLIYCWKKMGMDKIAPELFKDTETTMKNYD